MKETLACDVNTGAVLFLPLSVVDSTAPTAHRGLAFSSDGGGTCSADDTLMKSLVNGAAEDAACSVWRVVLMTKPG